MAINRVTRIDDRVPVKTVLASVSDKSGLDALVAGLLTEIRGLQILSTGGTYDALSALLPPAPRGSSGRSRTTRASPRCRAVL